MEDKIVLIMDALSNKVRLKILKALEGGEKSITELTKEIGISRPLLYMHLTKLVKAGLVETEVRHLNEPPYVKRYIRAKKLRIILDIPSLNLNIREV